MSHSPLSGAVLFAKDLPRAAQFYEKLLSMTVVDSERGHVVLESPHRQLVVHAIPRRIAQSIKLTSPPARRTENPVKLFFFVTSLAQARAAAVELGGALDPKDREWEARGFRACDGHDPEGNVLQLREPVR